MKIEENRKYIKYLIFFITIILFFAYSGCVNTSRTTMESHKKGMEGVTEGEYVVPKRPVDRAYIGSAWSKQFGPVEDPITADIRTKKEKSLNKIQQDFAYNRGVALGGRTIAGPMGEVGLQGAAAQKAMLENVEIISAVSIADIPFEPNIPYITEALRLGNFRLRDDAGIKAGIGVSAGTQFGTGTAVAETKSQADRGTEGEGLVVAYKLHTIDMETYKKNDVGNIPLDLDKYIDFPQANLVAVARLQKIEPGTGKSLPRNLLWACPKANALSRDMVAAWVVELKSTDPKRKSLTIAFPAFPKVDDCHNFSGVIFSRINPLTDKIERQKLNITVLDADLTDALQPKRWVARMSLTDESFNIRLVTPNEIEK
ncbi:MAG TPA: hypothetical protein PKW07_02785 [Syntrophorhabdaceae bacterium]|nr:hypothetical protein [Syntrophorhabdaceae bacterium]